MVYDEVTGDALSVFGTFDVGLGGASVATDDDITESLALFLRTHGWLFGAPDRLSAEHLVVTSKFPLNDASMVVHIEQLSEHGLRVFDSELTAHILPDGSLRGVHGPVRAGIEHPDGAPLDLALVLELASAQLPDVVGLTDENLLTTAIPGRLEDSTRWFRVEHGYDAATGSVAWNVSLPAGVVRVQEATRAVSNSVPHRLHEEVSATIRHFNWPKTGGRVTA